MQTVIHAYNFDIRQPEQAAAWQELESRLKSEKLAPFETWSPGGKGHYMPELDGRTVTLETAQLFDNQWNTAPIDGITGKGLRVFDWAVDAQFHNPPHGMAPHYIRRGHYLIQTAEMREIRRNTNACGYCGHQAPAAKGDVFCPKCLGSSYLKESDLPLLRMVSVDTRFNEQRPPLSTAESAHLLPLYHAAQLHGTGARSIVNAAKARASAIADYEKTTAAALAKRDGFLWLLDHGFQVDNVIYYSHTGRFSFGWRQPMAAAVVSQLLDSISEFPFPYDIACEDGRKLSGN